MRSDNPIDLRLLGGGILTKVDEAREVIGRCRTTTGFHASAHVYPELWLRDLVYCEGVLLKLGQADAVRNHLDAFLKRQRVTGQLPNVITSRSRSVFNQAFHYWTSDNEVLFLVGIHNYARVTDDSSFLSSHEREIELCVKFVESRVNKHGFLPGMDWRDAMPNYLGKMLLTNQLLLAHSLALVGRESDAASLKAKIVGSFFDQELGFFADSLMLEKEVLRASPHFDVLGNSLAVIMDVLPSASGGIAKNLERARTDFGYRNLLPPCRIGRVGPFRSVEGLNAFVRNGAVLRNRPHHYQNSAIWPFVESRVAMALLKVGRAQDAERLAELMLARQGLNEWYSPADGQPGGSRDQLWTATAVLQAAEVLAGGVGVRRPVLP